MGILDMGFDPRTQGLLAAAFQGLQASGPSRTPISLGQIIGQGGMAGLNEYRQAQKDLLTRKMAEIQMRLHGAQATSAEQDLADRQAWAKALDQSTPAAGMQGGLLGAQTPTGLPVGPLATPPGAGPLQPAPQNQNQALAATLKARAQQYADILSKNPGLVTTKQGQALQADIAKLAEAANKLDPIETFHSPTAGMLPTGMPGFVLPGSRGTVKPLEGLTPPQQLEIVDLGPTKIAIDKARTAPGSVFGVGVSPNTAATNAVTTRGQNMTDARVREQIAQGKISAPIEVNIDGKNTMVFQHKSGEFAGHVFDGNGNDVTTKIAPQVKGSPLDPGRISMALQASSDLNQFENLVFPKDAKGNSTYNRSLVAAMSVPLTSGVGTEARMAYSAIENAVAAKLRGETGAATNPGEIENTANRFRPTMMDTEQSARDKVTRLREFMGMTLDQLKESNHISQATYDLGKKNSTKNPRLSTGAINSGWTEEKERRYQELKAKQNGTQ